MWDSENIFRLYLDIRCGDRRKIKALLQLVRKDYIHAVVLFAIMECKGLTTYHRKRSESQRLIPRLLDKLDSQCRASDPYAQFLLGWLYQDGIGCEVNLSRAIELYEASARANNIFALCHLGYCYSIGEGVEKNVAEANRLYRRACDNPIALCNLACNVLLEDVVEGVKLLRKAANAGFGRANYLLGYAHEHGVFGLQQLLSTATQHYILAAKQGHDEGAFAAGLSFYRLGGIGNARMAFRYFSQAAQTQHAEALYFLGHCYSNSIGTDENQNLAYQNFLQAANLGNTKALVEVGVRNLRGRGIQRNDHYAVECFQIAANRGNPNAACNLALCYEFGNGVNKDEGRAIEIYERLAKDDIALAVYGLSVCYRRKAEPDLKKAWEYLMRAVLMKLPQAYHELADRYFEGHDVERNVDAAIQFYKLAAAQGFAKSQRKLGRCYYYGVGVSINYSAAIKWFREASKRGDAIAALYLGSCYEDGTGVLRNTREALTCYRLAAKRGNKNALRKLARVVVYEDCIDNALAAAAA